MSKHVGLCLYVKLGGQTLAVLQRRGEFNFEKMGPESWPGACQPTVHGGVNDGETEVEALWRETTEELCGCKDVNSGAILATFMAGVREIEKFQGCKENGRYFVGRILPQHLGMIRLHAGSGGLKFATPDEVLRALDLSVFLKSTRVGQFDHIVMFPDDKAFVRVGFDMVAGIH